MIVFAGILNHEIISVKVVTSDPENCAKV